MKQKTKNMNFNYFISKTLLCSINESVSAYK